MRQPSAVLPALLVLAASPPREAAIACPHPRVSLAELVERAPTVVFAEFVARHEVEGEAVAEVRVVEWLKGEEPVEAFFYPLRYVAWDTEEGPRKGERAVLLLEPGTGFEATRAFWKGLDALRKGRPFLVPGALGPGHLPVRRLEDGSEGILLDARVELPAGLPAWRAADGDPDFAPWMVDEWTLVAVIREMVEATADPAAGGLSRAGGEPGRLRLAEGDGEDEDERAGPGPRPGAIIGS